MKGHNFSTKLSHVTQSSHPCGYIYICIHIRLLGNMEIQHTYKSVPGRVTGGTLALPPLLYCVQKNYCPPSSACSQNQQLSDRLCRVCKFCQDGYLFLPQHQLLDPDLSCFVLCISLLSCCRTVAFKWSFKEHNSRVGISRRNTQNKKE